MGVAVAGVLACLAVATSVGGMVDAVAAQAAADAAALAGAGEARARQARAQPVDAAATCAVATATAARSGATVVACTIRGDGSVVVEVSLDRAVAGARAGRKGVGDGPG